MERRNKRIKTEKSNDTLSSQHQHLVLDDTTIRAGNGATSITKTELSELSDTETLETVTILGSSGIHCIHGAFAQCKSLQSVHLSDSVRTIGYRAFAECTSLRSIRLPDSITTIENCAFVGCSSLKSIYIPNGVTSIENCTFYVCKSLMAVNIPIGVTTIKWYAFYRCKLLQSIHIPNTVETIRYGAFEGCDALERRLKNGTNYHPDIETWLRQRFDNLPIHRACYDAYDAQSAVDHLSKLIQDNHQALTKTDAMGMTPLHILCCNPHATVQMVQLLVEKDSSVLTHSDVTESTPLQLFLKCRSLLLEDQEQQETETETMTLSSIYDFLNMGISSEDLEFLLVLNDNQEFVTSWRSKDDSTNLFSFMTTATLSSCRLDVVYTLAMKNLDAIVS